MPHLCSTFDNLLELLEFLKRSMEDDNDNREVSFSFRYSRGSHPEASEQIRFEDADGYVFYLDHVDCIHLSVCCHEEDEALDWVEDGFVTTTGALVGDIIDGIDQFLDSVGDLGHNLIDGPVCLFLDEDENVLTLHSHMLEQNSEEEETYRTELAASVHINLSEDPFHDDDFDDSDW